MKKMLFLLGCAIALVNGGYALSFYGPTSLSNEKLDKDVTIYGPATLNHARFDSLSVKGPLTFNELEVHGTTEIWGTVVKSQRGKFDKLSIIGPFEADSVRCEKLKVIGPVNVTNLTVKGHTEITGPLTASKCSFEDITIHATEIRLNDVKAEDIEIKSDDDRPQTLYLSGNTVIDGDIDFKSKKGSLVIHGQGVQIKGDVSGVIKK